MMHTYLKSNSAHNSRNFKISELLNREPIALDQNKISSHINGRVILITGAAGSIGSELTMQICAFSPYEIFLIDQSETALGELEITVRERYPAIRIYAFVASITDARRMAQIIRQIKPEIIFHAAAYKHVPIMEMHPYEAIKTNVMGTRIIADLAAKYQAKKFIFISTDKAINPSSVMGATKRMAEIYLEHLHKSGKSSTQFITTRFGNVLGSNGSFITIFKKQIESGGPVTVTHPEVTRYLMTAGEACQLVLEASAIGVNGDVLSFDMGHPVLVSDIARKMICLYGLRPGMDIKIIYTGLRPGEKLHEDLISHEDTGKTHIHPKIRIACHKTDLFSDSECSTALLVKAMESGHPDKMVALLKTLIPEYISKNSDYNRLDNTTISSAI